MLGNKRAQAATEYLIILAIVIVIALVVVGAMGGIPRLGGGTVTRSSEAYWQQADIAITSNYFGASDSTGTLVVKNNKPFKVEITKIELKNTTGGVVFDYTTTHVINPGKDRTYVLTNATALPSRSAGDTYAFDVVVTYNNKDSNLGPYTFTGEEPLSGEYQ